MGVVEQLIKLAELHRVGTLSDTEYTTAKARLLGRSPVNPEDLRSQNNTASPTSMPKEFENAPKWMKSWGWFLVGLGGVGFCASAFVNWKSGQEEAGLLAGLLNPMFFIGMPIGLYWLARGGVFAAMNNSNMTQYDGRKLNGSNKGGNFFTNESTLSEGEKRERGL